MEQLGYFTKKNYSTHRENTTEKEHCEIFIYSSTSDIALYTFCGVYDKLVTLTG